MTRQITKILGPPGTGKTTHLIDLVRTHLEAGGCPDKVVFCSFTKAAANEAYTRAVEGLGSSFSGGFNNFRTLHSLAYERGGLRRGQILDNASYEDLGRGLGLSFDHHYDSSMERMPWGGSSGDNCLRVISLSRSLQISLLEAWGLAGVDVKFNTVESFATNLDKFKADHRKLDFNDILDRAIDPVDAELFIVDEAQDLTPQQWACARRLSANASRVVLAGDDDQAIYHWAGADPLGFLHYHGELSILDKSHRLTTGMWQRCEKIRQQMTTSHPKIWNALRESPNDVEFLRNPEQAIDLKTGSWLLLARTRRQAKYWARLAHDTGVVYKHDGKWSNEEDYFRMIMVYEGLRKGKRYGSAELYNLSTALRLTLPALPEIGWNDIKWPWTGSPDWMNALPLTGAQREYVRTLKANGEDLLNPGRVVVSTIHNAKGAEADYVLIDTRTGRRIARAMAAEPDPELRVWYVAFSRARKKLFVVDRYKGDGVLPFL